MSGQFIIALLAGIIPALLWLLFWIREDRKHPEPKKLLALTFFAGMLSVVPVLWLEMLVVENIADVTIQLIWWAAIEELGKFLVAYFIILRRKEVDEPIDCVIYMVTIALGFAAVENTLFIFSPIAQGLAIQSILTGNLRFIGATLLHIIASSTIGISMALAFYKKEIFKRRYLAVGLILAIVLHGAFNLTIMMSGGRNGLIASSVVWIGAVCILLFFEKVKKVHPVNNY